MEKSKILLICPKFMGYDKQIKDELGKWFDVTYLDNELILKDVRKEYQCLPLILKAFFKLFPVCREYYRNKKIKAKESVLPNYTETEIRYDYIICINGDGFSDEFYKVLFKTQNDAKRIIYLWDDYGWLFKNEHTKYFEKKFSFNIKDCKKRDYLYLPMFTKRVKEQNLIKKYDICLIASANDQRISLMKKIYTKYKDKYKFFIYFYSKKDYGFFCYDKPLSDNEYITILGESKAVIDCYRGGQKGPTTRVYDSISTRTKIISTNQELKKYPVYNDNVLIIDSRCIIPESFISTSYVSTNISSVVISDWINHLLNMDCDYYSINID